MSVPLHYSGTAAVVIDAVTGSSIRNDFDNLVQGLPIVNAQDQHQPKNCCHLPQNYYNCFADGGDCTNHFQPLVDSLQLKEISGNQHYHQQQQQQQQQQRTLEKVVPHQLAMTSSVDETVVVSPVKSMKLTAPINDNIDFQEVKLESAKEAQDYPAETQTEWRGITDDEGRFGTPGAAGLEYQNYQLQQQNTKISDNQDNTLKPDDHLMDQSTTAASQLLGTSASLIEEQPMEQPNNFTQNTTINTNNISDNIEQELVTMPSEKLYNTLKEYNALQDKYHTVLLLPKESKREVTAGGRNGSAYILRCLKIWYELPSDVLFSAMSLVDGFLDRMAVKPKHMACISVASFHIAIRQLQLKSIPPEDLVTISQCGCTAGDLERMANVIANKLGVQMGHVPITSVNYLRIYYALFHHLAQEIGGQFYVFYQQLIKLEDLENRLEILLCDVKTTVITPSTLAMVLICLHLDFHIKESYTRGSPELKHVFEYILFLQQYMGIPDRVFTCGFSIVSGILSHYNGQNKQPYKQRLVWKLSSRTLRVLRPINRFFSDLPTIQEGISNTIDDGCRSRTESLSSEEEEDWPTSPIIPIFEQC